RCRVRTACALRSRDCVTHLTRDIFSKSNISSVLNILQRRYAFSVTTSSRRPMTQAERVAESAQRLMQAAIELIAEKGFQRTSASEIAERAGYSRTMVAARHGSKER